MTPTDPMNTPLNPAEPYTAEGVARVRRLFVNHSVVYGSQEPFTDEPMIARLFATIDALTTDLTAARTQLATAERLLIRASQFLDREDNAGLIQEIRNALATPEQPSREGEAP